jgi:twitching motility protein PilT
MIDYLNETRRANIITIEDPIEYVHPDKMAIVSQREVGIDTHSFHEALKQVLRQTPDVILIGELRDLDTLNVALQAAETGHLVFATLHTSSAAETLDRISNMYQPHERAMLWLRLSVSLRGIVAQKLLRRADGEGRIAAQEIMVVTPTISKQLEDGQSSDLYTAIRQDGTEGYWGMQTMNQCLDNYVCEGFITEEEAMDNAGNSAELKQMLRRSAHSRVELVAA